MIVDMGFKNILWCLGYNMHINCRRHGKKKSRRRGKDFSTTYTPLLRVGGYFSFSLGDSSYVCSFILCKYGHHIYISVFHILTFMLLVKIC